MLTGVIRHTSRAHLGILTFISQFYPAMEGSVSCIDFIYQRFRF
jgi:hypothetical protein